MYFYKSLSAVSFYFIALLVGICANLLNESLSDETLELGLKYFSMIMRKNFEEFFVSDDYFTTAAILLRCHRIPPWINATSTKKLLLSSWLAPDKNSSNIHWHLEFKNQSRVIVLTVRTKIKINCQKSSFILRYKNMFLFFLR